MKTALLILAIEILLPGGTLLALTLLAWQRRKSPASKMSIPPLAVRLMGMQPQLSRR